MITKQLLATIIISALLSACVTHPRTVRLEPQAQTGFNNSLDQTLLDRSLEKAVNDLDFSGTIRSDRYIEVEVVNDYAEDYAAHQDIKAHLIDRIDSVFSNVVDPVSISTQDQVIPVLEKRYKLVVVPVVHGIKYYQDLSWFFRKDVREANTRLFSRLIDNTDGTVIASTDSTGSARHIENNINGFGWGLTMMLLGGVLYAVSDDDSIENLGLGMTATGAIVWPMADYFYNARRKSIFMGDIPKPKLPVVADIPVVNKVPLLNPNGN